MALIRFSPAAGAVMRGGRPTRIARKDEQPYQSVHSVDGPQGLHYTKAWKASGATDLHRSSIAV